MFPLKIRFKKNADGGAILTCERADGSVTWQRPKQTQAAFFALHDLTHYAVETVLHQTPGFFSLLAGGWEISDFGPPWPKGALPGDAASIELVVGLLDSERAGGVVWSAEEFNEHIQTQATARAAVYSVNVSDEQLKQIRTTRSELFSRWNAVDVGDCLELIFERP